MTRTLDTLQALKVGAWEVIALFTNRNLDDTERKEHLKAFECLKRDLRVTMPWGTHGKPARPLRAPQAVLTKHSIKIAIGLLNQAEYCAWFGHSARLLVSE